MKYKYTLFLVLGVLVTFIDFMSVGLCAQFSKSQRIIIQWKNAHSLENRKSLIAKLMDIEDSRVGIQDLSLSQRKSRISVLEVTKKVDLKVQIQKILNSSAVESATLDFKVPLEVRGVSDEYIFSTPQEEPYFSYSWHLPMTGVDQFWQKTLGSASALIAVVDLGFEVNHKEFKVNELGPIHNQSLFYENKGEVPGNKIDDDGNGLIDDHKGWNFAIQSPNLIFGSAPQHGTATASIIGGRINGFGSVGVCPHCQVLPVVIDDRISSIILAYQYIGQFPVGVVNNSWGFKLFLPEMAPLITAIEEVARQGRGGLGTGVVFAMSNVDRDDCRGSSPDISSLPFVIAVSGVHANGEKIKKSGYGECLDLVAPTSPVPEGGIFTADRSGSKGINQGRSRDVSDPDYTKYFYGTSAAAPQVAGSFALLLSRNPSSTREEIEQILFESAIKLPASRRDDDPITGKNPQYGYGLLYLGGS